VSKTVYEQSCDGEWEFVPKDGYVQCCDCGLVHRIKHRIRNGFREWRWTRDNRRTAQSRRHMKPTVEVKT